MTAPKDRGFRTAMLVLIDPPGRYSPKMQWEEFLKDMQALPQDNPQVKSAVSKAAGELKIRTAGGAA